MVTILLTGIPSVGKTGLIDVTQSISEKYYEKSVESISLGDIVAEGAAKLWKTAKANVPKLDYEFQKALRWGAIPRAAFELGNIQEEHVIVDTPMTMFVSNIPDGIFTHEDIAHLHAARSIDYFVTLIDDPNNVKDRLKGTPYPQDVDEVLSWMAMEVVTTANVYRYEHETSGNAAQLKRHLVIPRKHSDETLVKLLNDPDPPICYFSGPITHLKLLDSDSPKQRAEKIAAKKRMIAFRQRFQEYAVVVVPIEMADSGITNIEREHTVFRDMHWFVANADFTLAYFPGDYRSEGSFEEMRGTLRTGKPVILIHPGKDDQVFGVKPWMHFRSEDEFFEAVATSRSDSKYEHPDYEILRKLLDRKQDLPRYAHLRPYAVAVDIYDGKTDQHMLIKQGKEPFKGYWILVAGKREQGQTDKQALRDEAWQEVGLLLEPAEFDEGYRLYRTDYADEQYDGSKPRYVRFYRTQRALEQGTPRPDNATDHKEVDQVGWFSREEILRMEKVVPATRAYFEDLSRELAKS